MIQRFIEAFNRPHLFRTAADECVLAAGGLALLIVLAALFIGISYAVERWQKRRLK